MSFASPGALALLALAVPVVLVHVLRPRRTPVTVPSILLWRRVEQPVSASQPWQRLRWSVLLVAQLLAVVLLAVAVARPERVREAALAEHTVFIVDASGSMAATDGDPDRLADARARAAELRGELPDGGVASIVAAGDTPRVALTASADRSEFERALRTIDLSEGVPDFADAFALAQSLQTGESTIGYVLITDGGIEGADVAQLPGGTRVETIGSQSANRAITRLVTEMRGAGLHVRVSVANTGTTTVTQGLRVDVDGATAAATDVELEGGERRDVELDVPAGDLVEAFLDGDDLLAVDDHAVAVAAHRRELHVLVAGDALFWQELLTSIPGVTVDAVAGDAVTGAATNGYDLAVLSGVDVPADIDIPFVAVAPPGGVSAASAGDTDEGDPDGAGPADTPVAVAGIVERPAVTLVRTTDALLSGLDLTDVAVAAAQRVSTGGDVLVAAEGAPLLVRGTHHGQPFAYLTFALRDSNLPVQLAFPLLADRLLGELTGVEQAGEALTVGERLPMPAGTGEVSVVGPDAETRTVAPGDAPPRASRAGFWRVQVADRPAVVVAVNPPAAESAVAPTTVVTPTRPSGPQAVPGRQTTSLVRWVLGPLLVLVAAETWLAWRRVGVGRRQWQAALALRALVAVLLLLAIVNPTWHRSSERVATVFVVDGSASVGAAGSQTADAFVAGAVQARRGDATAGVVVFGGNAHVDRVMEQLDRFDGTASVVDTSATDVAAGLRLGAALLPADARRRLVLISDGRATAGDVRDELDELAAAEIPVDVVTLPSGGGPDAAVTTVDAPRLAHPDERLGVDVLVESATAGPATVILRRDGEEVTRQAVALAAGSTTVSFEDVAPSAAGTVLRYQATVSSPGDGVAENDTGFAAVPVEGPLRVLVVEGTEGEATSLVAALGAAGVGADVVGVADLPELADLLGYAGIVLADVDAHGLTGAQIETLTTAVRDLGRGLVTIGGTQSYGVGGYRRSPLSDLLPVDSEILDPERRRTVAEVLSIDVSESMGACHCAGTDRRSAAVAEGGVNKTDISRAAAERTIAALAETDEVGVLAWNSTASWVIPLQALPPAEVVDEGLRSLHPAGNTDIGDSLGDAAEALRASDAELRHIILFSDGFTDTRLIDATADQAGQLYAEHGITTSVLATGEGAAPSLEHIAEQGHGRFYAGADLEAVPQIMAEEAVVASRDFVNEGSFLPEVTSDDDVVASLTATPPLLGYVATTAKAQATTLLRIGPDRDPLLVTWQAGLGRVTSWTSDVNDWSAGWTTWDGFVEFWSGVVKDTLPAGDDAGAVQAQILAGRVHVSVESAEAFPDGATGEARVSGPDGQVLSVELERTSAGRFEGEADAPREGSYAVGATVLDHAGASVLASSTLATSSYAAEFVPGETDRAFLERLASGTGGRPDVAPEDVWDPGGLADGVRRVHLIGPLLLAAALLWPIAVVLSRVRVRRQQLLSAAASASGAVTGLGRRVRAALPGIGGLDPSAEPPLRPPPAPTRDGPASPRTPTHDPDESPPAPGGRSLDDLLARTRQRRRPPRSEAPE